MYCLSLTWDSEILKLRAYASRKDSLFKEVVNSVWIKGGFNSFLSETEIKSVTVLFYMVAPSYMGKNFVFSVTQVLLLFSHFHVNSNDNKNQKVTNDISLICLETIERMLGLRKQVSPCLWLALFSTSFKTSFFNFSGRFFKKQRGDGWGGCYRNGPLLYLPGGLCTSSSPSPLEQQTHFRKPSKSRTFRRCVWGSITWPIGCGSTALLWHR